MSAGLQVKNLNKNFGGITVASNINIDLPPGARTALIGPNGAGKTTFANLITGILPPSSGEIYLDGKNISGLNEAARVKAGIAKTFQITTLFKELNVREHLRLAILERNGFTSRLFRRANSDAAIEAEIDERLDQMNLSKLADMAINNMAYGQQRLVELAMTLALKPRILILDEPAAGVPSSESYLIIEAVAKLDRDLAVLIIEHDMKLVFEVANSIIVLVNGEILTEGTPAEISANPQVRSLYLGERHE
ncbi:MAG: branched-chain amino acid ABC transporter ATP-binding protein [Hyphomicrobiales bacterium]|nr:MAG: branched-chain amino acid ABC transporter ATP-binding protein [Hyphomicrobiales bacterium]